MRPPVSLCSTFAAFAAIGASALVLGCGGTKKSDTLCGAGTMLVNNECLLSAGGASGTDVTAGSGGGSSVGGATGDVGSGGTIGGSMGGSGGGVAIDGGKPQDDLCAGHEVVATGMPGLMDDFEDGDGILLANDGRFSSWFLANNGTCTLTPPQGPVLPEPPVPGATINNASKYAMHVTATQCTEFSGPSLQTPFNLIGIAGCSYDVTQYDGMYFWATGNVAQLTVSIGLTTTIPTKYGGTGTCAQDSTDKGCWDAFNTYVRLTPDWKEYTFKWGDLHQAGFGTKTPWDTKLAASIYFSVSGNQATGTIANFSIDNVGFYKGTPPTDPPMAGQ
jgi:hypothetical protein